MCSFHLFVILKNSILFVILLLKTLLIYINCTNIDMMWLGKTCAICGYYIHLNIGRNEFSDDKYDVASGLFLRPYQEKFKRN